MSVVVDDPCPRDVLEAIPWYPDGALRDDQVAAVEAHAAECSECRHEIERVQGLPAPAPAAPDADALYARVLGMIAEGGPGPVRARSAAPPRRPRWLAPAARVAAAAAALVVAVLVGYSVADGGPEGEPVYRTAASSAGGVGVALDVVFRGDATADEILAVLQRVDGHVVAGPNALGVYRIALAEDAHAGGVARELLGDGDGIATFAEPALR